ncbi:MAG: hypothetical protein M9916_12495 [Crocinitomicaceae bacterium]|nr:hypothetical protein [Crocinitomicaceae bacterium]
MKVLASCFLSPFAAVLNGTVKFQFQDDNWLKECYHKLMLDYPKFYKMDDLSKMAILSVELLKENAYLNNFNKDELELIFANSNASQHTDVKFIDSYTNIGNPSPSLFVYTLPNILTGELAIKHKWYGENTFLIASKFDTQLFENKLKHAQMKGAKHCLCGWVDSKVEKNGTLTQESFLFLVALNEENSTISEELEALFKKYKYLSTEKV